MPESQTEILDVSPLAVFKQMVAAQNQHDLEGMLACFSRDYQSEQPFHPERNFEGKSGVRKNWEFFFKMVPDMQVDILSETVDGDTVWSELHMYGTRLDGTIHSVHGVTIQRVREGLIVWARLYIDAPDQLLAGGAS